jgi:serine/threonine protein kinase
MQRIADYRIKGSLGDGGLRNVWLAATPSRLGIDEPEVVLRLIRHIASDDDFARLVDHLRHYASIRSPHLVPVYDVGQQGDLLYVVSRYHQAGSLAQPARALSRVELLRSVGLAARGAHDLHERGLAHRAIQPSKVLLVDEADRLGRDGEARLGDVGLDQILSPGLTVAGSSPVEAIEHLAPELIQGRPASRGSDIWALGVTLHRVLTGASLHPDLPEDSLTGALRHLLNERPILGDALRATELKIIESAVALDPAERPATAAELAEDIFAEADRQAKQVAGA